MWGSVSLPADLGIWGWEVELPYLTGMMVLDFLGLFCPDLVLTTSYRKGKLMILIIIYHQVPTTPQGWFQNLHLYYLPNYCRGYVSLPLLYR